MKLRLFPFVLIFVIFSHAISLSAEGLLSPMIFPRVDCTYKEQVCFEKASQAILVASARQKSELIKRGVESLNGDEFNSFMGLHHKTPYVFVVVPGLIKDNRQTIMLQRYLRYSLNQNVIGLVLPGHGADYKYSSQVKHEDWSVSVDNALKTASYLGEKVILVGDSTGALLALEAYYNNRTKVGGLVLLEAAQSLRWVSVVGSYFLKGLDKIINFFNSDKALNSIVGKFDLSMGVEVFKLTQNYIHLKKSSGPIDIPLFIHNFEWDYVVSAKDNIELAFSSVGPVMYTNEDILFPDQIYPGHGMDAVIDRLAVNKVLHRFFEKHFGLKGRLPQNGMWLEIREEALKSVEFLRSISESDIDIALYRDDASSADTTRIQNSLSRIVYFLDPIRMSGPRINLVQDEETKKSLKAVFSIHKQLGAKVFSRNDLAALKKAKQDGDCEKALEGNSFSPYFCSSATAQKIPTADLQKISWDKVVEFIHLWEENSNKNL